MKLRLLFFITLLLPFSTSSALERILTYDSEITLNRDATLLVSETIQVIAEGDKIKRGIYRDFPTDYMDRLGHRYQVGFKILGVLKNGISEPFQVSKHNNGVRILIGNKDVYLNPGTYTYTIRYQTNRQLGFFDDHDELYWNVTGNDWDFPILKTTATVYLPQNIPEAGVQLEAYTGAMGQQGRSYTASMLDPQTALFKATTPFYKGQGLTIVVSWPKGIVTEPGIGDRVQYFFTDNKELLAGLIGLLIIFLYYFFTWRRVGKDPEPGIIVPSYHPPKNFSPASMRFIRRMAYDHKTFAAAIISLAVKGYVRIEDSGNGKFILHRENGGEILAASEKALLNHLFSTRRNTLELEQRNHSLISKALKAHENSLRLNYEKTYFQTNSSYLLPGIILSVLTAVAMIMMLPGGEQMSLTLFFLVWLSFWSIGVFALLASAFKAWQNVFKHKSVLPLGAALILSVFAIPFVGGEVVGIGLLIQQGSGSVPLLIPLLILVNYLFYQWLKAPTMAGRRLLDQIEGFKLYLSVAEKDELNLIHAPDKTPALFEQFLPYALALDVEQTWSEKFASTLAQNTLAGQQPAWYASPQWHSGDYRTLTSTLSTTMTSAISSSSVAPGSSSGSSSSGGGGGSSGGGGGGGGGGGW